MGYQWRIGNKTEARKVMVDMLWLNPNDNQGIRDYLACLDRGMTFEQARGLHG